MDYQGLSFGSFSKDETFDLFNRETRDLQFVWQGSHKGHGNVDNAECTPIKSKFLDVSSCVQQRENRSFSPRAGSPNIPPNPPTSPVEEPTADQRKQGSKKLNVNAIPFVPNLAQMNHSTSIAPFAAAPEVKSAISRQLDFTKDSGAPVGNAIVGNGGEAVEEGVTGGEREHNAVGGVTGAESAMFSAESAVKADLASEIVADQETVHVEGTNSEPTVEDEAPWPNLVSVQTSGQATSASRTASDNRTEEALTGQAPMKSLSSNGSAGHSFVDGNRVTSPDSTGSSPSDIAMATHKGATLPGSNTLTTPSTDTNLDLTSPSNHSTDSSATPNFETVQNNQDNTPHEATPTSPSSSSTQDKEDTKSPTSELAPNNLAPETKATPTVGGASKAPAMSWASIVSRTPETSSGANTTPQGSAGSQVQSPAATAYRTNGQKQSDNAARSTEADPKGSGNRVKANGVGSRGGLKELEGAKRDGHTQFRMLGEQLQNWRVSHRKGAVLPRGLINVGNWCYMHAPLQALLSIPAITNLFRTLNPNPPLTKGPSAMPFLDAMIEFVHEFRDYPKSGGSGSNLRKRRSQLGELSMADPFKPEYIYTMLHNIRSNLSYKGRQEDAEEFLGCMLDGLHEEMVSANKAVHDTGAEDKVSIVTDEEGSTPSSPEGVGSFTVLPEGEEEAEWEQVGPKNKSTITRQASFSESPITEIFGGKLRSCLHRQGAKESATLEPFFSLQLDIQSDSITSVKEALDALVAKETVNISEVDAHKRLTLARLPPVLIFHLKRFIFTSNGSQKLSKHVHYTTEMELAKELLAPAIKTKLSQAQRTYRLWAVVYHHGKTATGGHYTSDVYHSAYGGWIRMDDSLLKPIPDDYVLTPGTGIQNKNAYLLFYRRADTIKD